MLGLVEMRGMFDEAETLVIPVSSAEAERSFSALRTLKTWLRTMAQVTLNSIAVCHVQQDKLDIIDVKQICQQLISVSSLLNENSVIIYSPSSCFKPVCISFFCWTQKKIFWRMSVTSIEFFFSTMEVNGVHQLSGYRHSSKYLLLCSEEERNSYRFKTTWGRVNDDRMFIFGWTVPLMTDAAQLQGMSPSLPISKSNLRPWLYITTSSNFVPSSLCNVT